MITGLVARKLAVSLGLLPPSRSLGRWASKLSLETGVAVGVSLAVVGFLLLVLAIVRWSQTGFSQLDPRLTMRFVVPSMTLTVIGTSLTFLSFLFGLVGLQVGPEPQTSQEINQDEPVT